MHRLRIHTPSVARAAMLGGASAVTLALGLAACSEDPIQPMASSLDRNRAQWEAQGPTSYLYDFRRECFCLPEFVEPVVVRVVDGAVAGVTFASNGEPVPAELLEHYPTIDGLFDLVEEAIEREADEISVTYHPGLGYPTQAFFDYDPMIADEELGFHASDVRLLVAEY